MAISEQTISEAVRLLRQAAPGAKIILFGSHARGQAGPESDLDFLVVEREVEGVRAEMVRLRDALRPLQVPADVLVTDEKTYERWRDTPGTIPYVAAKEGRVFDAVA